jgi:thermitase
MQERDAPIVAVIDSGVDYNHPAIHDQVWHNPEPGAVDSYGWDFISGDSRPYDDGYHGTQVASLVLAVAPRARIMALKAFNPWGVTSSSALLGAFHYAVDHGAKIILCGWATRQHSNALEQAVSYAREQGVIVVAAAGDRGDDLREVPAYPAAFAPQYENVVAVTGVTSTDQLVQLKGRYANFNSEIVSIAAPGDGILVAEPRSGNTKETSTGLSAALVAGTLARIQATGQGNAPDWLQRLRETAKKVPALENGVAGGLRLQLAD